MREVFRGVQASRLLTFLGGRGMGDVGSKPVLENPAQRRAFSRAPRPSPAAGQALSGRFGSVSPSHGTQVI